MHCISCLYSALGGGTQQSSRYWRCCHTWAYLVEESEGETDRFYWVHFWIVCIEYILMLLATYNRLIDSQKCHECTLSESIIQNFENHFFGYHSISIIIYAPNDHCCSLEVSWLRRGWHTLRDLSIMFVHKGKWAYYWNAKWNCVRGGWRSSFFSEHSLSLLVQKSFP